MVNEHSSLLAEADLTASSISKSGRSLRFDSVHSADSGSGSARDKSFASNDSVRSWLQRFTVSSRERALATEGVGEAAFLIRDAVFGHAENPASGAYDPYRDLDAPIRNAVSIICRRLCASRLLLQILLGASWCLVLLTFLEPPPWCRGSDTRYGGCQDYLTAAGKPADNSTELQVLYYPNSRSTILTIQQSRAIEALALSIITSFMFLRLGRDGFSVKCYMRAGYSRWIRLGQIVCLMLLAEGLFTDRSAHHAYVRLLLLLSFLPSVQKDIRVLIQVLPEIFNILTLLAVFMTFYAWFGTVMFLDTAEGEQHFSNFVEAIWTLWICVTTANYPDVMMPAYNDTRWAALYFVTFMILSFFFLMNVILASVVNEYDSAVAQRKEEHIENATTNLKAAFKLLDVDCTGRIDRETVMSLFCILNQDFPEFRTLSDEDTKLLFAILDKDGTSTITETEFMDFGNVLLLEFIKASAYDTFLEIHFPKIVRSPRYQRFCKAVKSPMFEYIIDIILVLNAVVIGIQTYPELSGQKVELDPKYWDGSIDTIWELIETIFTGIYLLEVVAKITVFGWKRYSESQKNVFDFTVTLMAVVSSIIVYYPNDYSDSRLIRMIVMVRVLRLLRLLTAMQPFQMIGTVSAEILPAAASVLLLLFFLMYFFAALGMHLFGGMITRDPDNPLAYLVLGTDFSDNNYWANNFNDMISGMNVLFNLLVINNWTECEVGFEAVAQTKLVRLFFLAFHVSGVILVNNLVVAVIINSFMSQLAIFKERTDVEIVGNGEAVIHHRQAVFDAAEITGTTTTLTGDYIARLRKHDSDSIQGRDQDRLRMLFTQRPSDIEDNSQRSK